MLKKIKINMTLGYPQTPPSRQGGGNVSRNAISCHEALSAQCHTRRRHEIDHTHKA